MTYVIFIFLIIDN